MLEVKTLEYQSGAHIKYDIKYQHLWARGYFCATVEIIEVKNDV